MARGVPDPEAKRTNCRVPAGHERKITAKIRASLAKRRLQQRPGRGPRSAPLQPRKRAEANAKTPEMVTC
ncbi:hypothetical protein L345_01243, partial [Ophiophagus hannah]